MSLITEAFDSLPYVDTPLSDQDLAAARAAIQADISSSSVDPSDCHPALMPAAKYTPAFSDFIEREHARLDDDPKSKLSGIDLQRYQDLEAPENTSGEEKSELLKQWSKALKQAYTSSEYVQGRMSQLDLLEKNGKDTWLAGNKQLEDILRRIEAELADVRKQQEEIDTLRRTQQEAKAGEIQTLEETWKKGVGRVLETEVAAEGLKQQIFDVRKAGTTQSSTGR